jgi:hypothetical protein
MKIAWACLGAAVVTPAVWIWASLVCSNDARMKRDADRKAHIEECAKQNAVAVQVLNSGTVSCVQGSNRKAK